MSDKKYKVGFYGGKFLPFHVGHDYCIDVAEKQCEKLYVILFYGGDEEQRAIQKADKEVLKMLSLEDRLEHLKGRVRLYDNVEIHVVDVTNCKLPDGSEDWDAETPLVLAVTGRMDAVFSSEPRYDEYFKRAYPWAEHILIDPPREHYPISATMIREFEDDKERYKWIL